MPQLDCTGPDGKGPMTGMGRGCCIISISTPKQELDYLKNRAHSLELELRKIKARISHLKTKQEAKHAGI
jgi:hypothetical protein